MTIRRAAFAAYLLFIPRTASLVLIALAFAASTQAQQQVTTVPFQQVTIMTNDPNTWPAAFDGTRAGGPFQWVDGASANLATAVQGGQEGAQKLYICRAANSQDGGIHLGKYFNGQCNIGWGGNEVVVKQGFQVLVNTRPELARFLPQQWVAPATPATYVGGMMSNAGMRVCRATYTNGSVHPGKEYAGRCNYGYGGKEIVAATYQVLLLGFDKTAWATGNNALINQTTVTINNPQNVQNSQIIISGTMPTFTTPKLSFDVPQSNVVVAINWQPGGLGRGFELMAQYSPVMMRHLAQLYLDDLKAAGKPVSTTADQMVAALKQGNAGTQSIMVLQMVGMAKYILDNKTPDKWTPEENSFLRFLVALATEQRQGAAADAMGYFRDWELKEMQANTQTGLYATINPAVNPPPEILAMAQAGYKVAPQNAENFRNVLAGMSVPIALVSSGATAGILVATGLAPTVVGAILPNVQAALNLGASVGRAAAGMVGLSGGIAVATLMIQAAIMKGIDVVKYNEYKDALNLAAANAKVPYTTDNLKSSMQSVEGRKALTFWLTAQAATGTAP